MYGRSNCEFNIEISMNLESDVIQFKTMEAFQSSYEMVQVY